MITRRSDFFLFCFAAVLSACGVDRSHRYGDKIFDKPNNGKISKPPSASTDAKEVVAQDPEEIREKDFHMLFLGRVDIDSIWVYSNRSPWFINWGWIKEDFTKIYRYRKEETHLYNSYKHVLIPALESPIRLEVWKNTAVNGRSDFAQNISTNLDNFSKSGSDKVDVSEKITFCGESISGDYRFDVIDPTPECPSPNVCMVRGMISLPDDENGKKRKKTVCFYDNNLRSVILPYGVSVMAGVDQIAGLRQEHGPYIHSEYIGEEHIECDDPRIVPQNKLDYPRFVIRTTSLEYSKPRTLVFPKGPKVVDRQVDVEIRLLDPVTDEIQRDVYLYRPYLDRVLGLHSNSLYYFQGPHNEFVGLKKTIFKEICGESAKLYQGISLDVFFENCKNFLNLENKNDCPAYL